MDQDLKKGYEDLAKFTLQLMDKIYEVEQILKKNLDNKSLKSDLRKLKLKSASVNKLHNEILEFAMKASKKRESKK